MGFHSFVHDIYATDGSLEGGRIGVYIVRSKKALRCWVGRRRESWTTLRVETGDSFLTLEHAKDLREPIFIFTDSANHLSEIDDWIGSGRYRSTVHFSKDGDILRLHGDARRGCPLWNVPSSVSTSSPLTPLIRRIPSTWRL